MKVQFTLIFLALFASFGYINAGGPSIIESTSSEELPSETPSISDYCLQVCGVCSAFPPDPSCDCSLVRGRCIGPTSEESSSSLESSSEESSTEESSSSYEEPSSETPSSLSEHCMQVCNVCGESLPDPLCDCSLVGARCVISLTSEESSSSLESSSEESWTEESSSSEESSIEQFP
ncbi:hypothetical protein PVAND_016907 [Polypedilum vanderplanki]|uniref:Uncharacterized protein n=1 Tax=Polypedilum vanderplanki TaxID=319348 RepID=A0A9J6BGL8_POLVA|nr:hypothetical protein PVAND_016907 [Polypedilum vanderplanki]